MDLTLADVLTLSTVRIETPSPKDATIPLVGTGFFFAFEGTEDHIPTIVTCAHNVVGANEGGRLYFQPVDSDGRVVPDGECTCADIGTSEKPFADWWHVHPDYPSVDLAVMLVWDVPEIRALGPRGASFSRSDIPDVFTRLTPVEEVVMVGYPNGQWDAISGAPIVRRGITATDYRRSYEGQPEFLTDIAAFEGSSGSPIVLFNPHGFMDRRSFVPQPRLHLLGVHAEGVEMDFEGRLVRKPAGRVTTPVVNIPMNLGVAIKAEQILRFGSLVRQLDDQARRERAL